VTVRFVGFFKGARYAAADDPQPVPHVLSDETASAVSNYPTSGYVVAVTHVRSRDLFDSDKSLIFV
jgi:hypothetical protein